ncbi:MAG: Fur family transcriptional regulator [Thermoplasmata archaeon]
MEKYVKILKDNQIRITSQRLEILRFLDENRVHPNADSIYLQLKKKNPALSRTTVYNSLEALNKHNMIQVLTISESELRYDFEMAPHHHFLCKKCGVILDINVKCPYIDGLLKGEHKIEEIHGYFKGTCKECLEKKKTKKKGR